MTDTSPSTDLRRRAGWLPDQDALEDWLEGHRQRAEAKGEQAKLHPVLVEFQALLDSDPVLRMYLERMITEVPRSRAYRRQHLTSVKQMLLLINEVLTVAPEFGDQAVTLPLAGILDWTMGTSAGFAAYRDPRLNAILQKLLNVWCQFLSSEASRYVLNDSPTGWKSEDARRAVGMDQFEHDPADEYWGFASWNDYFTRTFKDGQRPVDSPDDDSDHRQRCAKRRRSASRPTCNATIVSGSRTSPTRCMTCSRATNQSSTSSVEPSYQAFLSATDYHRWHSPVAGTIVRAFVQQGTYYSEADSEGADAVDPRTSQGYQAHVAPGHLPHSGRQPRHRSGRLMPVGMNEVSSCLIDPSIVPGHHVAKGDELGYFQFGGSTHCLIFGPDVIADFSLTALPRLDDPNAPTVKVRSHLALRVGSAVTGATGSFCRRHDQCLRSGGSGACVEPRHCAAVPQYVERPGYAIASVRQGHRRL